MADQPALRIAMIGAGKMGQCAHLRNYAVLDGCEVVALAELRPKLGERVAERYGVSQVFGDHRQLLDAIGDQVDAIVSIQPFTMHGRLLPELLATGKPTLVEKPLARSVDIGRRLLEAASSTRLFLGYHKRSDPAVVWAKQQMDQWRDNDAVGPMRYVRVTMPPGEWTHHGFFDVLQSDEAYPSLEKDSPARPNDTAWTKQYDKIVDYYIHQVNLMRHLLGEDYEVAYADPAGVVMSGRSAGGVPVTLEMAPYESPSDWQESALVCFERAKLSIELPPPMVLNRPGRVCVYAEPRNGEPHRYEPRLPWRHAMAEQARFFVAAARGEQTPLCRPDEALRDLEIARDYLDMLIKKRGQ